MPLNETVGYPLYVIKIGGLLVVFERDEFDPDLSIHVLTFEPELNVNVDASAASNHNCNPETLAGMDTGAAPPLLGGVTPLMITALVVGDAKAPTCDVRTMAPNPGRATGTPPDLDTLALRPGGTYCAAALTNDVKSDPDGRRTGIIV